MKRIAGIFLAALLALTVLPHGAELVTSDDVTKGIVTTAYAEESEYNYYCYYFKEKDFVTYQGEIPDPPVLEGVTWNVETETLTLENAHLDKGIHVPGDATIVLKGKNTITASGKGDAHQGIASWDCYTHKNGDRTLKIKGDGELTITVGDADDKYLYGITSLRLNISGACTINVIVGDAVKTGEYYGGDCVAIHANAELWIGEGCTVNATCGDGDDSRAIYTGIVKDVSGTVTATCADGGKAIYGVNGIYFGATANVTAYGEVTVYKKESWDGHTYSITKAENVQLYNADAYIEDVKQERFVSGETRTLVQTDVTQPIRITGEPQVFITGTPHVGRTLTANVVGGVGVLSYQWAYSDGDSVSIIEGATDPTYVVKETDMGKRIIVLVRDDAHTGDAFIGVRPTETVTAARMLKSIQVTTPPTKTEYDAGQNFDATGMVVTATYSNNDSEVVTGYTIVNGNSLTVGQTTITVRYAEDGVSKDAALQITVKEQGSEQPTTYTVTIVPGEHIKTNGALTQNVTRKHPMVSMFFYTADGYYFPEGYTVSKNGVTAQYMNSAQIMVTGTPTDNVTLTLPEPGKRLAGTVRIVGTAQVGQTLTAVLENGDVDQSALAYQWEYSEGVLAKRINGATSSTYTLTAQDEGKSIFVQVSKAGEPGGAIYSATVGPIEASSGGEERPETPPRYYYNSSTAEGTKGETKNAPKTADAGALAYLGLALSSYVGTALVTRRKKEF